MPPTQPAERRFAHRAAWPTPWLLPDRPSGWPVSGEGGDAIASLHQASRGLIEQRGHARPAVRSAALPRWRPACQASPLWPDPRSGCSVSGKSGEPLLPVCTRLRGVSSSSAVVPPTQPAGGRFAPMAGQATPLLRGVQRQGFPASRQGGVPPCQDPVVSARWRLVLARA